MISDQAELDPVWQQDCQARDISEWSEQEVVEETRLVVEEITIPPLISDNYEKVRIWKR